MVAAVARAGLRDVPGEVRQPLRELQNFRLAEVSWNAPP